MKNWNKNLVLNFSILHNFIEKEAVSMLNQNRMWSKNELPGFKYQMFVWLSLIAFVFMMLKFPFFSAKLLCAPKMVTYLPMEHFESCHNRRHYLNPSIKTALLKRRKTLFERMGCSLSAIALNLRKRENG